MGLSTELISQFAKITNDGDKNSKNSETTVYGTAVEYNGSIYVRLDGSDLLTPVSTTTDIKPGERVTVLIKNHTAIANGNISSPAARTDTVKEIGTKISEFEIIISDKVSTQELEAERARITDLQADNVTIKGTLTAQNGEISNLKSDNVDIKGKLTAANADIENLKVNKLDAERADLTYATIDNLSATNANIYNLESTYGTFKTLTTENLIALDASVRDLDTKKLSATEADIRYANIDFSNIEEAAIEALFAGSGLIRDLIVGDGTITGELVGVTIKGDLIEGNTIVAEKLVVKGEDGLYYKLNTDGMKTESQQTDYNSLNGSIITAKSITATKISVDDLVAFDATIGGFKITEHAIYSGVKSSATNTTRGIYLDDTGQIAIGDSSNFLNYFKDADGTFKLEISADNIILGASRKNVEEQLDNKADVDDVSFRFEEQNTAITTSCSEIIMTALESYVETGNYDEFKETVEAQLSVMADQISMNFTYTNQFIAEVDEDMQSQFEQFYKHITFSQNGIKIGDEATGLTLTIDNDMISFQKKGEQFGWWDGVDFHTGNIVVNVDERAQFGDFAFIPRSDGSLMFLKVGDQ